MLAPWALQMQPRSSLSNPHPTKEPLPSAPSVGPANNTGHREREGSAAGAALCKGLGAVSLLLAAASLFGTMAPHWRAGPGGFSAFPRAPGCPDTINNTTKPQWDRAISLCLEKGLFVPLPSWRDAPSPRQLCWELLGCGTAARMLSPSTSVWAVRHGGGRRCPRQVFRVRRIVKVQSPPQSTAESTAATTKIQ